MTVILVRLVIEIIIFLYKKQGTEMWSCSAVAMLMAFI